MIIYPCTKPEILMVLCPPHERGTRHECDDRDKSADIPSTICCRKGISGQYCKRR